MIKEAFFPTFIYGKDLQLDTKYFEKEIVEWSKQNLTALDRAPSGGVNWCILILHGSGARL